MTGAPSIAFLGCGQAARMHSKTLARIAPDSRRLYASRNADRARSLAAEFSGVGVYGSYAEAIEDDRADAVLIATPPASHLELALAAYAAGRHVIVEKPAFMGTAEFDRAWAAARAADRALLVAENYFYKPILERLRRILTSGELGRVLFVHVNALKRQPSSGWRNDARLAGGGALFEGGVHWISFVGNMGLELVDVRGYRPRPRRYADAGQAVATAGGSATARAPERFTAADALERSMMVALAYAEGAVGSLSYSWETHSPLKGVRVSRVYGTDGTVAFESNGVFLMQTGRRPRFALLPGGPRDAAGYAPMFRDFVRCLETGAPARFTPELARRDLERIERAYATAASVDTN